ncbi:MAG: response regulator transcription factor [Candidatus Paceibacterota bacterium]|jgi:DNA-binding response OmpR family regulator
MKVLVVEDDGEVSEMIKTTLIANDNVVEIATDGVNGSFLGRSFDYDVIILDNSLPKKDGLTVCKEVRSAGKSTPILFLTVDGDMETKISAFDRGADDFMMKPFALKELHARLKAITRRPALVKQNILRVHDMEMDTDKHYLKRGGKRIHLTHKEYGLLEYFMKNTGIVVSRALLMEHVWTADSNPFSNTIETHIRNLRKKINQGNKPDLIANITGRGYVMDTPENLKEL